jgi:hypothetical protein
VNPVVMVLIVNLAQEMANHNTYRKSILLGLFIGTLLVQHGLLIKVLEIILIIMKVFYRILLLLHLALFGIS